MNAEPLRKILELEQEKGYVDAAVFGGLDKFLGKWSGQAEEAITDPRLRKLFAKLLTGSGYASLTNPQRKEWVDDVLDRLAGMEGEEGEVVKPLVKTLAALSGVRKPVAGRPPALADSSGLDSPIEIIKGISSSLMTKFGKLGVKTVRDLLYFFPHRHLDYSQVKFISQLGEGEEQTVMANVWQAKVAILGGRRGTEAIVGDETGNIRVVWFNQPYLTKKLPTNARVVLSGRVSLYKGRPVFESPEWEMVEAKDLIHTGRLVPVYPLTQGLRPRQVRKLMKEVVDQWAWQRADFLPPELRQRCDLLELSPAISQAHYPENVSWKDQARVRLAFDELFLLQLGVMSKKHDWQASQPGSAFNIDGSPREAFVRSLPFVLTAAQQKVLQEILVDLQRPQPMCRLLQGEVGSGKTVVAAAALLTAVANDCQGAFMAPTEILAEQHFNTIDALLSRTGQAEEKETYLRSYAGLLSRPLTVALLVGDINQARKQELQQRVLKGGVDIIIGTHTLIQKGIKFPRLGLAVVDEQHRFGVSQRSALWQKGFRPHMLVMTATPIPRTLALTLYGDLDLSVIDELPPGRQTVKTKWLKPWQRDKGYAFLRGQISSGRQAFIVCPLIEESEAIVAQAAVVEYQRLSREVFPDMRIGLLHGRLSAGEKDEVMHRLRSGDLDILVSTSVVEVGIDVPNATVMLVESADRFGLSQLHQFRGRVGRGAEQSYCMLLAENPSEVGRARLDIIEKIKDGFDLAEEDLKLRGPGEFFGTRQSGLPDLRMARLSDVALLELARNEAIKLFQEDPTLDLPRHRPLAKELARVWPEAGEWS
ncbi:MAG: ATP-dependent DNA helicase RecG [Dehalococcoidales bacterium]|jgi:ATP-dependent DNA helicase RecG|nr:ATP-dependent DNA helicase RecG [Dehalococcoidales bacterium]MDP7415603.1 ATP-dependent DNA helicase RecG [Dehalococcoidales bacterium]